MRFGIILVLILSLNLTGCLRAFKPTEIKKHPDAQMLVLKTKGKYIQVAIYNKIENKLIVYGWIESERIHGWTLGKYQWDELIKRRSRNE